MKRNDPRGVLLGKLSPYTNSVPLYNTTFFVTYYDVINNKTVATKKINERWGFDTSINSLNLNIPANYSDQAFDYDTLTGLPSSQGILGIQSVKAENNQIFVQYNVTPKLGEINVIYVDQLENTVSQNTYYEPINTQFNEQSYLPSNENLVVNVLYPKDEVTSYTDTPQTVIIQSYVQPVNSQIFIKYETQDNQVINGVKTITGQSGDRFDVTKYTGYLPDGYNYVNYYNPDNITVFPRDPSAPNTIYFIVTPSNPNNCTIKIEFVNQDGSDVSNYNVYGNAYTDFNLVQNLNIPNGYTLVNIENSVNEFIPNETQTAYVQVKANPQPAPVTPSSSSSSITPITPSKPDNTPAGVTKPGSAYVVFIDENKDVTLNPCTYDTTDTSEQGQPQPVTTPSVITMSSNPIQFNDLNNITLDQIYYNGNPLSNNSLIEGPNLYWQEYQYDTEFTNMYEYQIDSNYQPYLGQIKGNKIVVINCYPAYVKGVSFQLVGLNRFKTPNEDYLDLPKDNQSAFPKGWSINVDPITDRVTYTVPYQGTTTVDYFINAVFGGSNGVFQDSDGDTFKATNDRKITFRTPYTYMINIEQLS